MPFRTELISRDRETRRSFRRGLSSCSSVAGDDVDGTGVVCERVVVVSFILAYLYDSKLVVSLVQSLSSVVDKYLFYHLVYSIITARVRKTWCTSGPGGVL